MAGTSMIMEQNGINASIINKELTNTIMTNIRWKMNSPMNQVIIFVSAEKKLVTLPRGVYWIA